MKGILFSCSISLDANSLTAPKRSQRTKESVHYMHAPYTLST